MNQQLLTNYASDSLKMIEEMLLTSNGQRFVMMREVSSRKVVSVRKIEGQSLENYHPKELEYHPDVLTEEFEHKLSNMSHEALTSRGLCIGYHFQNDLGCHLSDLMIKAAIVEALNSLKITSLEIDLTAAMRIRN